MMNVYEKLCEVQHRLNAPKNQKNEFGKYSYRSCEDILESVKPLLYEVKATLNLTSELEWISDRYYVKATAVFTDTEKLESVESVAYAREADDKKGMDVAQITGSSTSYARKYALQGLLCIDDSKIEASPDPDTQDNRHEGTKKKPAREAQHPMGLACAGTQERLIAECARTGYDIGKILKAKGVQTPSMLTEKYVISCINDLKGMPDKKKPETNTSFKPYTPEGEDEGMRF